MGHRKLKTLEGGGELWTGDDFEYLYVQANRQDYDIPPDVLYEQLTEQVRGRLISAAEKCVDWKALTAALHVLELSNMAD